MNCNKCKKIKLNHCDECDFIVSTNCVEYNGDRLDFEDPSVVDGSSRTLSELLVLIDGLISCQDRDSKLVQSDYTVIEEDTCKIILLDTDFEEGDSANVITLPVDADFINKVLIFKDISTSDNVSGEVWIFDSPILYDFRNNLSSTSFNTLSNSLHRTLYLAYIKLDGVNYSWVAISSNTDLYVNRVSLTLFTNDWEDSFDTLVAAKHGNRVQLEGAVVNGDAGETAFILPVGFRPQQDMVFICAMDGSPYFGYVNVLSSGAVQPQSPGVVVIGDPITDNIFLNSITFYTQ